MIAAFHFREVPLCAFPLSVKANNKLTPGTEKNQKPHWELQTVDEFPSNPSVNNPKASFLTMQ